jgi:hypothetical protein
VTKYAINKVCHSVAHDYDARDRFRADPAGFIKEFDLSPEERDAFIKSDFVTLYAMGTNPFLLQQWAQRILPNGQEPNFRYWYAESIAKHGRPDYRT